MNAGNQKLVLTRLSPLFIAGLEMYSHISKSTTNANWRTLHTYINTSTGLKKSMLMPVFKALY